MFSRAHESFPPATAPIWRRFDRAAVERLLDQDEKPFTDDEIYLQDASFALHVFDTLRNITRSTGRSERTRLHNIRDLIPSWQTR